MSKKLIHVIDSIALVNGLSKIDNAFLSDLRELLHDECENGSLVPIYRRYSTIIDDNFYPDSNCAFVSNRKLQTREAIDLFNAQLNDFFTRNEIFGDKFMLYVNW